MWDQFLEEMTPLFEFFGIPTIILTPLAIVLYILFKVVIPRMLANTSNKTGLVVAKIVAKLFGELDESDESVKGIDELQVVKVIKQLPEKVQGTVEEIHKQMGNLEETLDVKLNYVLNESNQKLNQVSELVSLLSQAIIDERLIKPQNARILQDIKSKAVTIIEHQPKQLEQIKREVIEAAKEIVIDKVDDLVDKLLEPKTGE